MPQFAVLLFEGATEMPMEVLEEHMKVGARIAEAGGSLVTGYAVLGPDTARAIRGEAACRGNGPSRAAASEQKRKATVQRGGTK